MGSNANNLPYSYHTFLFPFIWKTEKADSWENFDHVLGKHWKEDRKEDKSPNDSEWIWDYAVSQYFTDAANHLIACNDDTVHCLYYYPSGENARNIKDGQYIITKAGKTYTLKINAVRMQAYDIGVAVLILELENYENTSIDDVNAINEYGRRINFPFLPKKQEDGSYGFYITADKIEIKFGGKSFSAEDYAGALSNPENIHKDYIMKPLQMLLDNDGEDNGGCTITSNPKNKSPKKLYIKPCIDDRMFVCCLVRDDGLSNELTEDENGKYPAECTPRNDEKLPDKANEETLSDKIYKLCFIETSLSCKCAAMKEEILSKCIYPRWIGYGTVHAVTHHSVICMTGEDESIIGSVINPFLTEYIQMAILTLVQRAAILMLSNEAAGVAASLCRDTGITADEIGRIEDLNARYVKMQSQLLLPEITAQEQGVEIYEMMWEQLYISRNKQELDERMCNLRDMADIANARLERRNDELKQKTDEEKNQIEKEFNDRVSLFGIFLAFIAMIPAIIEPLSALLTTNENKICYLVWTALNCVLIAATCILLRLNPIKYIKKIREKKPPKITQKEEDNYADKNYLDNK